MRMLVLCETLALVFVTLSYILKCLEYNDLRDLFDNRGKSIKMLNDEVYELQRQVGRLKTNLRTREVNNEYYRDVASGAVLRENKSNDELLKCRHKIYVLKIDIKRKDRAIVRYKTQNEVFKHGYHESEKRCEDLRDKILTERNVANWYKNWYTVMEKERSAYLYCLRQIYKEVENAKKE